MGKDYRQIWADKYKKDSLWMEQASENGFHVHHVDGDRDNNDPDNLMMIFKGDHMLLHNLKRWAAHDGEKWVTQEELMEAKKLKGQRAYEERLKGKTWIEIKLTTDIGNPLLAAKQYATHHSKPWPIILPKQLLEDKRAASKQRTQAIIAAIKAKREKQKAEALATTGGK